MWTTRGLGTLVVSSAKADLVSAAAAAAALVAASAARTDPILTLRGE